LRSSRRLRRLEKDKRDTRIEDFSDSHIVTGVTHDSIDMRAESDVDSSKDSGSREFYLLVYDVEDVLSSSERVQLYREMNRVARDIMKNGRLVERVQMSVWKLEDKEDAYRLASVLPESITKIKIYRVVGEE
jgi:hypothetical protein